MLYILPHIFFTIFLPTKGTDLTYEALAKYGGERGIRTLDAFFKTYMISNHALSASQTPLPEGTAYVQQRKMTLCRHLAR